MNSIWLYIIVFIFTSTQIYSQNNEYQLGNLILSNGDSIECQIKTYSSNVYIYNKKIKYLIKEQKHKIESSKVEQVVLNKMIPDSIDATKKIQRGPRKVLVKYKKVVFRYGDTSEKIYYKKFKLNKSTHIDFAEAAFSNDEFFFAHIVSKGKYDLYKRYAIQTSSTANGGITASLIHRYYLMTEEGLQIIKNYKKDLPRIYHACPELLKKIEAKKYRKKSMENIITDANNICNEIK